MTEHEADNPQPSSTKRLYRSQTDKQWAGVCGGLAEYLDTDPTLVRMAWVVVTIMTGIFPGLLAYIAAAIIIPVKPDHS